VLPDLGELVPREVAAGGDRIDAVQPRTVATEDLRLALLGELGIAVSILELLADMEGTHRLDLVLRRPVEQAVGAPHDVVLSHVPEQLADDVRGRRGGAHQVPPRRAELRVQVLVRADARALHR
jgi:hypothetical protein